MEKIIIYIRPINWTEGDLYGLHLRITGENPEITIDWGDGQVKTFYRNEIEEYHSYPKNEYLQYKVVVTVISWEIEFIDPCGGDCCIERIDFSGAPSIKEMSVENCGDIILNNPNLEKLTVRIYGGSNIDFIKCPNLRHLYFDGGINMKELNLFECHRLEWLEVNGSWQSPEFLKITIANDTPLKCIRLASVNLSKGCMEYLKRIIERNKGEISYEAELYV